MSVSQNTSSGKQGELHVSGLVSFAPSRGRFRCPSRCSHALLPTIPALSPSLPSDSLVEIYRHQIRKQHHPTDISLPPRPCQALSSPAPASAAPRRHLPSTPLDPPLTKRRQCRPSRPLCPRPPPTRSSLPVPLLLLRLSPPLRLSSQIPPEVPGPALRIATPPRATVRRRNRSTRRRARRRTDLWMRMQRLS